MARFDHLFIAPKDWEKTVHFYHQILGWEVGPTWGGNGEGPRGAHLKSSEGMALVIAEEHEAADQSWTHGYNGHRPTIHLEVSDLDDCFSKIPPGSHVLVAPEETHWGTRWFLVKDPDDNIIAFNQSQK